MSGAVARLQARVLGRTRQHRAAGWLDAVERGAVDADRACMAEHHGADAPSATPYLDMAMRGGDLAEWGIDLSGARPLRWREFQRLVDAGVPMQFAAELNGAGDILAGQIDLSGNGKRFALGGPDGRLLLVVRDDAGFPIDVIAFRIDAPAELAVLDGSDSGILGEWNLPRGRDAARIAMFETPLDWLRAGGRGICVYDWAAAVHHLRDLGEAVTLQAPPALAQIVRARLERGGLPLVASAVADQARLSLAERIGRGV